MVPDDGVGGPPYLRHDPKAIRVPEADRGICGAHLRSGADGARVALAAGVPAVEAVYGDVGGQGLLEQNVEEEQDHVRERLQGGPGGHPDLPPGPSVAARAWAGAASSAEGEGAKVRFRAARHYLEQLSGAKRALAHGLR